MGKRKCVRTHFDTSKWHKTTNNDCLLFDGLFACLLMETNLMKPAYLQSTCDAKEQRASNSVECVHTMGALLVSARLPSIFRLPQPAESHRSVTIIMADSIVCYDMIRFRPARSYAWNTRLSRKSYFVSLVSDLPINQIPCSY